jgi:ferredoxin
VSWWVHALLVLGFLNYLPYSKHLHVATSLFNVFFSNTSWKGERAVMRPMDLEADDAKFGAADVEDLTCNNLLDGYSCTECGRCTAACPANITGKPLSPRKIIVDTRARLMEKGPVAAAAPVKLFRASRRTLSRANRGNMLGIPNAPASLPDAKNTVRGPWTLCAVPGNDLAGRPVTSTSLILGVTLGGRRCGLLRLAHGYSRQGEQQHGGQQTAHPCAHEHDPCPGRNL